MSIPLVSIIIPTFNYGRYIPDAIESALNQTYPNIEVIVVDDGSTDNTQQIVKLYPVKYYYQKNQGKAAALNKGVKLSKGDFFLCLDADDKIAREYVSKAVSIMMKDPMIGFVVVGSRVWNEEAGIEDIWIPHKIFSKYGLIGGWEGNAGPSLIRRKAFDSLNMGYDTRLPFHWDLEICFRLLQSSWKMAVIPETLHWYRLHKGSVNSELRKDKMLLEKIVEAYMSEECPWIRLYKKFYTLYQITFGRALTLMFHPIAYFKGIRRKIQIKMFINEFGDLKTQQEVQSYLREILLTIDRQTKWSWNQKLSSYYEKRCRILESRLKKLLLKKRIT
jgi:glycosyltransferase involved in cell wall biosynthesis